MKIFQMAIRNVSRQRRRALLLGGAIATGFFVMTLMEGLTGGMTRSLRSNIESSYVGELYVSGSEWRENGGPVKRLADDRALRDAIESAGLPVSAIVRKSGAEATVVYGSKSARVSVAGIPWNGGSSVLGEPGLSSGSLEGMRDPRGIVLPAGLASRLGVIAGESVLVKLSTVTGQANVGDFLVAAVLKSQDGGDLFQAAFTRIETLNELLALPADRSQQLNLYLAGDTDLESAAAALSTAIERGGSAVEPRDTSESGGGLPGGDSGPMSALFGNSEESEPWEGTKYSIATLDDVAGQFTSILASLRTVAVLVFTALIAICMAGIVNTFRMILIERTREIGAMRAMGMRSREVERLFVTEAAVIAFAGTAAGFLVASVVMPLASLVRLGGGVFSMFLTEGRLAFSLSVSSMALYFTLVIGTSILAAFSPARGAARLKPVDALRS